MCHALPKLESPSTPHNSSRGAAHKAAAGASTGPPVVGNSRVGAARIGWRREEGASSREQEAGNLGEEEGSRAAETARAAAGRRQPPGQAATAARLCGGARGKEALLAPTQTPAPGHACSWSQCWVASHSSCKHSAYLAGGEGGGRGGGGRDGSGDGGGLGGGGAGARLGDGGLSVGEGGGRLGDGGGGDGGANSAAAGNIAGLQPSNSRLFCGGLMKSTARGAGGTCMAVAKPLLRCSHHRRSH